MRNLIPVLIVILFAGPAMAQQPTAQPLPQLPAGWRYENRQVEYKVASEGWKVVQSKDRTFSDAFLKFLDVRGMDADSFQKLKPTVQKVFKLDAKRAGVVVYAPAVRSVETFDKIETIKRWELRPVKVVDQVIEAPKIIVKEK